MEIKNVKIHCPKCDYTFVTASGTQVVGCPSCKKSIRIRLHISPYSSDLMKDGSTPPKGA